MDFTATQVAPEKASTVTRLVSAALGKRPGVEVLAADELRRAAALEADKALAGCDTDGCVAEIAAALGAEQVLFGDVSRFGDELVVSMTLLESSSARALSRVTVSSSERDLASRLDGAMRELLDEEPTVGSAVLLSAGLGGVGALGLVSGFGAAFVGDGIRRDRRSLGEQKELGGALQIAGAVVAAAGAVAVVVGGGVLLADGMAP